MNTVCCRMKRGFASLRTISHQTVTGFTLLELMIVLAMIAILAFVAIPTYKSLISKSRFKQAKVQLSDLARSMESHYYNTNTYQDLITLDKWTETNPDYTFEVVLANSKAFKIQATLTSNPSASCGTLTITSAGSPEPNSCW